MSALLDSLAVGFRGDGAQQALLDAARRDGLPGPRSEAWKYTSLRALERRTFAGAIDAAVGDVTLATVDALLADIPAPRIVFVNGRLAQQLSDTHALPDGPTLQVADDTTATELQRGCSAHNATPADASAADEVFARLNAALASAGVSIIVPGNAKIDGALHLVFIGQPADGDLAWHLRHRIEVGAGASLSIVEHHLADGEHRHLDTAAWSIDVGNGATLRHARVQDAAIGATSFLHTDARLGENATYERVDLELGAALSRHELNVRLEGDGASLTANGVLFASGRRHVDTRLGIQHLARNTACRLLWRGIGTGRGRAVFHGGITIEAGADGADAMLSNKNLLLGHDAEIDTQPVLVIHADEVKAAHGATVGQLDPTAMFYLRSRGLPEDDARRLLTSAFVREPLSMVADTALRDVLQLRLDVALGGLSA